MVLLRYLTVIVLPFLLVFIPASSEARSSIAKKVFDKVNPFVFQIKTALSADSSKASYGSGFIVSKDGKLITNYHVISGVLNKDKDYKMYLISEKESYEASVLAIDVINDLALLKIDKKFKKHLKLARKMPSQGAKVFSIGLPKSLNMSITEGNYNGILKNGLYSRVNMSSPLNSGMSGGPTVNASGEVVGVNVSYLLLSQNISFSVPVNHVRKLLSKKITKEKTAKTKDFLHEDIEKQIFSVQQQLMKDLSKNKNKDLMLNNWRVKKPSELLNCWSDSDKDEEGFYENISETCYLDNSIFLKRGVRSGHYSISYQIFETEVLNNWQLLNLATWAYNIGSRYAVNFKKKHNPFLTDYNCAETRVINDYNIPMLVNYCLRGYTKYSKIFNVDVKFMTLDKNSSVLTMEAFLRGFSLENIKEFIKKHVDSVRFKNSVSDQSLP